MTLLLPLMGFLFISLLIMAIGLTLLRGETAIERRLGELGVAGSLPSMPTAQNDRLYKTLKRLGQAAPKPTREIGKLSERLVHAGYRRPEALTVFFGVRLVAAIALFVLGTSPFVPRHSLMMGLAGAAFGWLLPGMVLARQAKGRQHRIRLSLPDALDLLVVSVEAGLGLDQAIQRVGDELAFAHPELSGELRLINLELRAGKGRAEALRNLAERTGVDDLSSLAAMLIQTDKFGTSVARSLRVHSDTLRTKRRQRAEEAAAKTGVKMVFPLVFCIFPAIWVVTIGPAAIKFVEVLFPLAEH
ncbi:MAG TPA: type II secretion system F family protein, partial [Albitalea sp.]|nr:type II secretion system F family protein [Albitalea sp.]